MSLGPDPLRKVLVVEVDTLTTRRLWRRISDERTRRARRPRFFLLTPALAVGVAAALSVLLYWQAKSGTRARDEDIGPLKVRGGAPLSAVETREQPNSLDLEDGSRLELAPRARVAPLENTNHSVVLFLQAGRTLFDVHHGGPRRWSIEAGLVTVEVTGTRFAVDRTPSSVTVEVERGVVLVRGERVPDRVRRLGAGERLEIDEESRPRESPSVAPTASSQPASHAPAARSAAPSEPSWRDLARQGQFIEAYQSLGEGGVSARSSGADIEQLLSLADVARFSGHPADAVGPLRRVIAERGAVSQGALAAFTLGRVHLDSLNDPAAAAHDFQDALSMDLAQALREDAHLRLVEALAKSGDRQAAHRAWEAYKQRFPQSTRSPPAEPWWNEP